MRHHELGLPPPLVDAIIAAALPFLHVSSVSATEV